ncbi:MATE family efflux transporter [Mesoplasma photuris]|uniref:MATE family efflux transporter n=1 Tax=Mesoplasma photuris TaxID=217731 RepID=UPI0004E1ABC2|nr:MATE family efflux transporter [Mesoplasma photuris]
MKKDNKFLDWMFDEKDQKIESKDVQEKIDYSKISPMTHREAMLRYSTPWKAILFFCLPTVIMMVVQGLFNILDKNLSLIFATEHAVTNWQHIYSLIFGSGDGTHSLVLEGIHNDAINGVAYNGEADWFARLFDQSTNPALKQILLDWAKGNTSLEATKTAVQNLFDNNQITISEKAMKTYINLATQYTTQSYNLVFAFSQVMGIGAGMHFAVEFGKGNREKLKEISGNGIMFSLMVSLFVAFLLFSISYRPWGQVLISSQMGDKVNLVIEELAWKDVEPLIFGLPIMFMANVTMNVLRSEGKMYHVLTMSITSIFVKVAVSIMAMKFGGMELAGAMLGSVISFLYQLLYCLILMFYGKRSYSKFKLENLYKLNFKNGIYSVKAGLPNFIMYFAIFINIFVSTAVLTELPLPQGFTDKDGVSLLQNFMSSLTPWSALFTSACIGLNQGARNIIAFNYGAGNKVRIIEISKRAFLLMTIWMVGVVILIASAGPGMLVMFSFDPNDISYGSTLYWYLIFFFMWYILVAFTYISLPIFQGTKKTKIAIFISSLRTILVFLPLVGIGFAVSIATGNPFFYFLFVGLNDLISALIILPLIILFYKRSKAKNRITIKEEPESVKIAHEKYLIELETKNNLKKA